MIPRYESSIWSQNKSLAAHEKSTQTSTNGNTSFHGNHILASSMAGDDVDSSVLSSVNQTSCHQFGDTIRNTVAQFLDFTHSVIQCSNMSDFNTTYNKLETDMSITNTHMNDIRTESWSTEESCSVSALLRKRSLAPCSVIRDTISQHLDLSSSRLTRSGDTTTSASELSVAQMNINESFLLSEDISSISSGLPNGHISARQDASSVSYGLPDGESVSQLVLGDRPPCVGEESTQVQRNREEEETVQRTQRSCDPSTPSVFSEDGLDVTMTTMNDSAESDDEDFMERSICHLGIKEETILKTKKRFLVHKLKKLGKHFHKSGSSETKKSVKIPELL